MFLQIKEGSLNAVIGPQKSGKTALLYSLLGEMDYLEAKVPEFKEETTFSFEEEENEDTLLSEIKSTGASDEDLKNKRIIKGSLSYVAQQPWL